jgi:hypothetical protein
MEELRAAFRAAPWGGVNSFAVLVGPLREPLSGSGFASIRVRERRTLVAKLDSVCRVRWTLLYPIDKVFLHRIQGECIDDSDLPDDPK